MGHLLWQQDEPTETATHHHRNYSKEQDNDKTCDTTGPPPSWLRLVTWSYRRHPPVSQSVSHGTEIYSFVKAAAAAATTEIESPVRCCSTAFCFYAAEHDDLTGWCVAMCEVHNSQNNPHSHSFAPSVVLNQRRLGRPFAIIQITQQLYTFPTPSPRQLTDCCLILPQPPLLFPLLSEARRGNAWRWRRRQPERVGKCSVHDM